MGQKRHKPEEIVAKLRQVEVLMGWKLWSRHGRSFLRQARLLMLLSFQTGGEVVFGLAPGLIVLMSLRPAIPWRVGLHQSPPPLYQPVSFSTSRLKLSTIILGGWHTFRPAEWGIFNRY
jgi:hypothetical protein